MTIEEITIKKVIIHILDSNLSVPILSESITPNNVEIREYFAAHILKVMENDSIQDCVFAERKRNVFLDAIIAINEEADESSFINYTSALSVKMFEIMSTYMNIPRCDVAFVKYQVRQDKYMAILKLNYEETFTHHKDEDMTSIIQFRATLPGPSKKVAEAIIIDMKTMDVSLVEKPYELDGYKDYYLSKKFVECTTLLSSRSVLNIIERSKTQIVKKFYENDPDEYLRIERSLYKAVGEKGEVDLSGFIEEAFKQPEVRDLFVEKLRRSGIIANELKLEEKTVERSFKRKKLKTIAGVKFDLSLELFENPEKFKIIVDPEGHVDIVVKDVGNLL